MKAVVCNNKWLGMGHRVVGAMVENMVVPPKVVVANVAVAQKR